MSALFDVIEVEIKPPHRVRLLDTDRDEQNAQAVVKFAVIRRGCENHFYKAVPAGKYKDGDTP